MCLAVGGVTAPRHSPPLHTAATTAPAVPTAVLGSDPVVIRRIGRIWSSGLTRDPCGAPARRSSALDLVGGKRLDTAPQFCGLKHDYERVS